MKKNKLIYIAVATLLCLSACSGEQPQQLESDDSAIRFAPALSDIAWSRAVDYTIDNFYSFQATCFNPSYPEFENGFLKPYFDNITFGRISADVFVTVEDFHWPEQREFVDFIAYAPSIYAMADSAGISIDEDDTHFAIINKTTVKDGKADYNYSIANIRIPDDIASQFDFITANASGSKFSSVNNPVTLPFSHRLAKVQLRAWGANKVYRIEIAGVRIGTMPLEGTFNLAPNLNGDAWTIPQDTPRGCVEYIFTKKLYGMPDAVVVLNYKEGIAATADNSVSILGNAGPAMVLPSAAPAWDRKPGTSNASAYFSVLMRATDWNDQIVAYPYSEDKEPMQKIWLAVDKDGYVNARLYRAPAGGFYTDTDFKNPYTPAASVRIKEYGWAAIPVAVDWQQGQQYIYTIDYSLGLGLKDPDDTNPGELILDQQPVGMIVTVADWKSGGNTDKGVPRK